MAEVPVQIRAGGQTHKVKLHLRQEDDQWRIFAMSAMYPDGEKSINFEAEVAKEGEGDPLAGLVGKPFAFAGMTLDGKPLDLSRYQGKVVLVDFWATWCGPCREEMPNLLTNYQKHFQDGFDVVAVSVDEDLDALTRFVSQEKPPWAIVADVLAGDRNSMASKYGIRSMPSTDSDRQGRKSRRGELSRQTLGRSRRQGTRPRRPQGRQCEPVTLVLGNAN